MSSSLIQKIIFLKETDRKISQWIGQIKSIPRIKITNKNNPLSCKRSSCVLTFVKAVPSSSEIHARKGGLCCRLVPVLLRRRAGVE